MMRLGGPHLGRGGNDGIAIRVGLKPTASFLLGDCPLAVAVYRHKVATLDGLVWGRGDPFFSLTLSLSNPTTWMELKHTGGRDSTWMADRRRGVGVVAACRRGIVGGSAESNMYSLAWESRSYGQRPSLRACNSDTCESFLPLGRYCVFSPLPMGPSGENHILVL
uniref:Uncharacterized protein n=1 Tax=Oryza punctata TaxID=4537 RepID=A0A0E0LNP7_ORYPU